MLSPVKSFTISLYLSNKPGVLNRVILVFSRRGWNIDSLSVSPDEDRLFSHCSIVASGDESTLFKIVAQLNKIVDVIYAQEHSVDSVVSRELALIKVACSPARFHDLHKVLEGVLWKTVDESVSTKTVEVVGTRDVINHVHADLEAVLGVLEVVRTGAVALVKGSAFTGKPERKEHVA
jgi:acetolactate synthase-1/3 small subunit